MKTSWDRHFKHGGHVRNSRHVGQWTSVIIYIDENYTVKNYSPLNNIDSFLSLSFPEHIEY